MDGEFASFLKINPNTRNINDEDSKLVILALMKNYVLEVIMVIVIGPIQIGFLLLQAGIVNEIKMLQKWNVRSRLLLELYAEITGEKLYPIQAVFLILD